MSITNKIEELKKYGYNLSNELENVISYTKDTLYHEFPTDVVTLSYIITAILDIQNTHARLLLNSAITSSDITKLKDTYRLVLETHKHDELGGIVETEIEYDDEVMKVLDCAKSEAKKMSLSNIGTEHILLAILNEENKFGTELEIFRDMFLMDYDMIFNMCTPLKNRKIVKKIRRAKKKITKKKEEDLGMETKISTKNVTVSNDTFISQYTVNLNKLAKQNKIDELIGRKNEANEIVEVLARRKKNNAVLVGYGGCGKTQIVYGLAKMIVDGKSPSFLSDKTIVMLDQMALVSGTHFRGMFEERISGLFKELSASNNYILFIDDIHNALKSNNKDKDIDISSMIGNALNGENVKIIATTTFKDYRNTIESNTQIARKFQKIVINPTSIKETIEIINGTKHYYEDYHNVSYDDDVIESAIKLADRYIADRKLPDSAFDLIDTAGARAHLSKKEPTEVTCRRLRINEINSEKSTAMNKGDFESVGALEAEENVLKAEITDYMRRTSSQERCNVTASMIQDVVSELTSIPISKLSSDDKKKVASIDKTLKKYIIGQDDAIDAISKAIKRNKVGLGDKTKTIANILLCGPTGVGKSYLAKKLAEEIFGDPNALVRIDMSEYSESNSVSKLTGSSPGYIGYENGGQLTEAIKNKQHCVLLLDEIEKANQEVYNVFLQMFDDGRLTDSSGQIVNFKNVIVLMTSNIGAKKAAELGNSLGFTENETSKRKDIVEKELKRKFTPEFLNRLDKIVYFKHLGDNDMKKIVSLELDKLTDRLKEIGFILDYDDSACDYIFEQATKDKSMGARPIMRAIQDNIEDEITSMLLENNYEKRHKFIVSVSDGKISIK